MLPTLAGEGTVFLMGIIGATPIGAYPAFIWSNHSVLSADAALAGSAFASDGR